MDEGRGTIFAWERVDMFLVARGIKGVIFLAVVVAMGMGGGVVTKGWR